MGRAALKVWTRASALTTWAEARERAARALAGRAARAGCRNEAERLRSAARLLQVRAVQDRAQAAACATVHPPPLRVLTDIRL
jgi:hypothetical protein